MLESLFTLFLMSLILIGAPGPAAMALAAMGSNHQLKQALPLVAGLICGVVLTSLLTSNGILSLFERWPSARPIVQLIGAAFIIFVAFNMLCPMRKAHCNSVPFGYLTGIVMNLFNPKAYATFAILISGYLPLALSATEAHLALALISALATLVVAGLWLGVGKLLSLRIQSLNGQRNVRICFAMVMLIFILPMLFSL